MPSRVLLDVADAPRSAPRVQVHRQLGIVLAGEGVELTGLRHHLEHVGRIHAGADRVGEFLHPLDELGVLDLVEGAGAARELDAGLQLAVALPGRRRLPLRRLDVQALDQHELAADMPLRRQVREQGFSGQRRLQ